MPFFANTPESLIGRSDSKNPSTTCRGITSSGRPCRRPVASPEATGTFQRPRPAKSRVDDPRDESLYCWQHKEQAGMSSHSGPGPQVSHKPILEERTSLDTLADRLGIADQAQPSCEKPSRPQEDGRPGAGSGGKVKPSHLNVSRPKPTTLSCCFCFSVPIEAMPPPRPGPKPVQTTVSSMPPKKTGKKPSASQNKLVPPSIPSPRPSSGSQNSTGGQSNHSATSQTATLMSLIPSTASPQTASLLLAELAKPFSAQDDPGYIYIFWLTPESQPATPPAEAARSLLTLDRSLDQSRAGDVLASFATNTTRGGIGGSKKILLKVGRATNVQRRLNEWQRQCGYNLSLIRYYPHVSSNKSSGALPTVRKMPHSHKVERLVHLELAGRGLRVADREKCTACGKEHREWFEVEATRQGVQAVDEVVRRWSDWDEAQA